MVLLTCRGPPPHLPELHFRPGQRCVRITRRAETKPTARPTLDLLNRNVQRQTKKNPPGDSTVKPQLRSTDQVNFSAMLPVGKQRMQVAGPGHTEVVPGLYNKVRPSGHALPPL